MTINWTRILKIVLMKRRLLAIIFGATVVGMLGGAILPLFSSSLIDAIMSGMITPWTIILGGMALITVVASPIANLYNTYCIAKLSGFIEIRVQKIIFLNMLKVKSHVLPTSSGSIINIFTNARNINSFVAGALPTTFNNIFSAIISFILMVYYSFDVAILVLLISGITSYILSRTQGKVVSAIRENYVNMSSRQSVISEATRNVALIKSQLMQMYMLARWENSVRSNAMSGAKVMYYGGFSTAISAVSNSIVILSVVVFGAVKVKSGSITYGDLMALSILASSMTVPFSSAAAMIRQFHEANVAMKELRTFLGQPRDRAISVPARKSLQSISISIDGVSHRYDGQKEDALSDLNVGLPDHGLVAIVGRNGAGKSTLLSVLLGEKLDYEGRVCIGGVDFREYDPQFLRKQFGSVRQESILFSGSLKNNFTGCNSQYGNIDSRLEDALEFAGASDIVEKLPDGINSVVLEDGKNFSGGERQRLSIARTIFRNPKVAVFDEPTSSLDADAALRVERNIAAWAKTRLVILVTHHLHAIKSAGLIVVLDGGRVVGQGTHSQLIGECEEYRTMWANYLREDSQ